MSSKASLYPYTDCDLLDEPEYYMYSAYGGEPLLREYISLRTQCAAELEKRHLACLKEGDRADVRGFLFAWRVLFSEVEDAFSSEVQATHVSYSEGIASSGEASILSPFSVADLSALPEIPTDQALRTLLFGVINRDASVEDALYNWLSRFLKRFETRKKLHTIYTPKMQPASQDFHILTNYGLLSLSLILYYEQTHDLKMLNGTLKLNDLLCSTLTRLNKPEDLFLTISALRKEVESVKQLASAQGLEL